MNCILDLTDLNICCIASGYPDNSVFSVPFSFSWESIDIQNNVKLTIKENADKKILFRLDQSYKDLEAVQKMLDIWFDLSRKSFPKISSTTEIIIVYPTGLHWQTFELFIKKIEQIYTNIPIILISEFVVAMMVLAHHHFSQNEETGLFSRKSAVLFFSNKNFLTDITYIQNSYDLVTIKPNRFLELPLSSKELENISLDIRFFFDDPSASNLDSSLALYAFYNTKMVSNKLKVFKQIPEFKSISSSEVSVLADYSQFLIKQRNNPDSIAVNLPRKELFIEIAGQKAIPLTNKSENCWKRCLQVNSEIDTPYRIISGLLEFPQLDNVVIHNGFLPSWCLKKTTTISTMMTNKNTYKISLMSELTDKSFDLPELEGFSSVIQRDFMLQEVV